MAPKAARLEFSTRDFTYVDPKLGALGYYIYVFTTLDEAVIWTRNVTIYHKRMQIWSVECVNEHDPKPPVPIKTLYWSDDALKTIEEFRADGLMMPYFTTSFEGIKLLEKISDDYR